MDMQVSAPPVPGSFEDIAMLEEIHHAYENCLPLVQDLRKNPDYVEANVYGNYSEEDKIGRLTSGPLSGSRGLALQVCLLFSGVSAQCRDSCLVYTRRLASSESISLANAMLAVTELLQSAEPHNCRQP